MHFSRQSLDKQTSQVKFSWLAELFIASLSKIPLAIHKEFSLCYFYQKSSFIYPLKHLKFTINAIFDNGIKVFIQKSKFIT